MKSRFLDAGEIVGTHGVRGEVKLLPWADGPEFLQNVGTFYLNGEARAVESCRTHKSMLLVKFQGVDSVESAQKLRGQVVRIDRTDVVLAEGSVFIADLIGLPVYAGGERLGALKEVLTLPANDVYVVEGGGKRWMIPAVSEFLERVDVEGGEIHVRLIEGLESDAN